MNDPQNVITFTDIPNILKITDDAGGTYAIFSLTMMGDLYSKTTEERQWKITLLGETIESTLQPELAVNKLFYVSASKESTAASIARALRNCNTVVTNFLISHDGEVVNLRSRSFGPIFKNVTNYFSTNIDSSDVDSFIIDGTSRSELYNAFVDVDIYSGSTYVTTLEKNVYDGEVAFNLSPVLSTIAEYGVTMPYIISVSSIVDGEYNKLADFQSNYIVPGYMVNQGYKYLALASNTVKIAQNYDRGNEKNPVSKSILYIYKPELELSFYYGTSVNTIPVKIDYLNSAGSIILTSNFTYNGDMSVKKKLIDADIMLDDEAFNKAFYIDVQVGPNDKVRYNVIKPIKATEYCQRVYFRNSYGGISFFDFTGQRSETRSMDIMTYEKNIFNYYNDGYNELEKIYNNDVTYKVTLRSHLIEEDGKYIFNDMIQSPYVWTIVNGEKYYIIIESLNIEETEQNGIFTAQITYRYSQSPSLL